MQENKRIILSTHFMLYGAAHALRDYLLQKKRFHLLFITLPFFDQRAQAFELYDKGKKLKSNQYARKLRLGPIDYVLDVFYTVFISLKQKGKFDVFIGVDPLNCSTGLFLKKIGKVKEVILYSIDFAPNRFKSKILNKFYHAVETFCVKNADECWNVSPRIAEGRKTFLHISTKQYPQKVVPIGVWNKQIKHIRFSRVKKTQVLFIGHLLEKQGVQLALKSVSLITKTIPSFKLIIVGGGEYERTLKELVKQYKIEKSVKFLGWIKDRKQIDLFMSESACAIALYKPEEEKLYNFTYYADPTKIKDYLSAGLPIIMTDVSYNAKEIEKRKCGIVVEYDEEQVAKAIISLLHDKQKLRTYRENALQYIKRFNWNTIFSGVI